MSPLDQILALAEIDGFEHWKCPSYLKDLNAIRALAGKLTPAQQRNYGEWLAAAASKSRPSGILLYVKYPLSGEDVFAIATLTPEQHVEAILRAVGKWKD